MSNPERMRIEAISGVGDIQPEALASSGILAVGFDINGTVCPANQPSEVTADAVQLFDDLRAFDIIPFLVTSNKSIRDNKRVASQLGKPLIVCPGFALKTKPNPSMILHGGKELDVDMANVAFVGDCWRRDGKAAKRAGLPLFLWTEKVEGGTGIINALPRGPREWFMRRYVEISGTTKGIVNDLEADIFNRDNPQENIVTR